MFLKCSRYKDKTYWRIVKSYREKETGKTKHKTIRYLGDTTNAFRLLRNDEEYKYNQVIMKKIQEQLIIEEAYKQIQDTNVKTAIRYIGGKGRKKDKYIELMPEHDIFVSLFSGGCSIELYKEPSKLEIINDINQEIINLLQVIRDNKQELVKPTIFRSNIQ